MKTNSVINRDTPIESLPEYLRVEEAAAVLDVSRGLIYEMARRGEIESRRFGRILRIPRSAVTNHVDPSRSDR